MKSEANARPRVRLFRNEWMERLTMISPRAFGAIWLAIILFVGAASWGCASVPAAGGLFLLGVLGWTLFEYGMHRFLFHWKTRSPISESLVFIAHGNHHADPNDPYRNLMPPIASVPTAAAIWALCLLAMGRPGSIFFLGFIIGYVVYDSVHYACHQFPMRRGLLRHLRRHHIRHHHARREGNYAITAVLWDWAFGTRISAKGN